MNRVELVGGLTREPEVRITPSGTATWFATLAVPGTRYDSSARQEVVKTTYVSLVAFGWQAEQLTDENYGKGDTLHVLGELDQYEKEGPDGQKERKTRVSVLTAAPVRRRSQGHSSTPAPPARPPSSAGADPWARDPNEPPPF